MISLFHRYITRFLWPRSCVPQISVKKNLFRTKWQAEFCKNKIRTLSCDLEWKRNPWYTDISDHFRGILSHASFTNGSIRLGFVRQSTHSFQMVFRRCLPGFSLSVSAHLEDFIRDWVHKNQVCIGYGLWNASWITISTQFPQTLYPKIKALHILST